MSANHPHFQNSHAKLFRDVYEQTIMDGYNGRRVWVKDGLPAPKGVGELVSILSMTDVELRIYLRRYCEDIAQQGVAEHERTDSIISKIRRGEAP